MRLAIATILIILFVLLVILIPQSCEGPEPIGPEPVGPETTVQYDNSTSPGSKPDANSVQYENSETLPPTGGIRIGVSS